MPLDRENAGIRREAEQQAATARELLAEDARMRDRLVDLRELAAAQRDRLRGGVRRDQVGRDQEDGAGHLAAEIVEPR
jgi:hypothetical protein